MKYDTVLKKVRCDCGKVAFENHGNITFDCICGNSISWEAIRRIEREEFKKEHLPLFKSNSPR